MVKRLDKWIDLFVRQIDTTNVPRETLHYSVDYSEVLMEVLRKVNMKVRQEMLTDVKRDWWKKMLMEVNEIDRLGSLISVRLKSKLQKPFSGAIREGVKQGYLEGGWTRGFDPINQFQ